MFKLIKIQLEIFASLQTLFPPLKIDIFCRIVPLFFIENFRQRWPILTFENNHFLQGRPPENFMYSSTTPANVGP